MKKAMTLKEMQEVQIKILEYIDNICKKNNIEYFLIGGTLIGAVRHHNFIPWDDDIDIALTRENYEKLLSVLKKEKHDRYELFDHSVNSSYFYPFAKVVDKRTELIENKFKAIDNYGVYVDIFAINGVPNDKRMQDKYYKKLKNLQRLIFYYSLKKVSDKNLIKNIIKKGFVFYAKWIGIDRILEKYNDLGTRYDIIESEYSISNWPIYKKTSEMQLSKNYIGTHLHPFAELMVPIPNHYDEILTTSYGDYMTLPKEEERITNHDIQVYWKEKDV